MHTKNKLPYYILAGLLFLTLKWLFKTATTEDLLFLLGPSNKVVSIFTGQSFIYQIEEGFYYQELNIIIGKSCAGFNFFLLSMLMYSYSTISVLKPKKSGILIIPVAFLLAYPLTIFANASRILGAIFIQQKLDLHYDWLHEAEGVFVYLFFLIAFHLVLKPLGFNLFLTKIFTRDAQAA